MAIFTVQEAEARADGVTHIVCRVQVGEEEGEPVYQNLAVDLPTDELATYGPDETAARIDEALDEQLNPVVPVLPDGLNRLLGA